MRKNWVDGIEKFNKKIFCTINKNWENNIFPKVF